MPSTAVMSGALGGTPLAFIVVWALNTYLLPEPMPAEVAVAVGSVLTSLISYLTRGGRKDVQAT